MSPWLRVVEAYLVQQLLRQPSFHRVVEKLVRTSHRIRHGLPPEEQGGTKIDGGESQPSPGFLGHFVDEIKTQLGREEKRQDGGVGVEGQGRGREQKVVRKEQEINADQVWQSARERTNEPAPRGFLGEYIEALKEQLRSEKKPPKG